MNKEERATYMRERRSTPEGREERRRIAWQNRHRHPEVVAARKARYYRKNKDSIRARKQGMTPEQWQGMFDVQGGRCAICGRVPDSVLAVDHDHACCSGPRSCGRCVRGLLCQSCNKLLGFAGDDPDRLRAAADYLDEGSPL